MPNRLCRGRTADQANRFDPAPTGLLSLLCIWGPRFSKASPPVGVLPRQVFDAMVHSWCSFFHLLQPRESVLQPVACMSPLAASCATALDVWPRPASGPVPTRTRGVDVPASCKMGRGDAAAAAAGAELARCISSRPRGGTSHETRLAFPGEKFFPKLSRPGQGGPEQRRGSFAVPSWCRGRLTASALKICQATGPSARASPPPAPHPTRRHPQRRRRRWVGVFKTCFGGPSATSAGQVVQSDLSPDFAQINCGPGQLSDSETSPLPWDQTGA